MPRLTPHALHQLVYIDPEVAQHRDEDLVLVLKMMQDDLDLLLGLDVDLEVMLRTRLGVRA